MPRIMETTVYKFDELSEKAKEKARDWYRQGNMEDNFWSESVLEDASQIAAILGIEQKQRPVQTMGGKTRYEDCIFWSGFWSQGDGASYEGWYRPTKDAPEKIREYAPKDEKLHQIADDLAAICAEYPLLAYVKIEQSGHYSHKYTMSFEAAFDDPEDENEESITWEAQSAAEKAFAEPLRDFAQWIYDSLEKEYEYRQRDEVVDEEILANEYGFTEDGKNEYEFTEDGKIA